mmetsp:Transcript_20962/g.45875  ORF Transcript_20962/g.45875 Transcript_20962/m.45875 type:complete len:137 (-) Transcript_20962:1933-2343(-)|eukprot:CAMPEP_0202900928 /NCGR_PEP_ID=MMETSP1392-20130828/12113_1 /ASSEMBLY_ACC=CAM_ASM_000868 /TAXON_ID=225041 /ORGANISM="Chlamydomonas chlamydogama, Strain SAG 11-48b" /LENGTH=136 /DNA_ID=CAMNT_0049587387 /DNA_START=204 /DNA_END=614 /DNA_ORIENTATION=-
MSIPGPEKMNVTADRKAELLQTLVAAATVFVALSSIVLVKFVCLTRGSKDGTREALCTQVLQARLSRMSNTSESLFEPMGSSGSIQKSCSQNGLEASDSDVQAVHTMLKYFSYDVGALRHEESMALLALRSNHGYA